MSLKYNTAIAASRWITFDEAVQRLPVTDLKPVGPVDGSFDKMNGDIYYKEVYQGIVGTHHHKPLWAKVEAEYCHEVDDERALIHAWIFIDCEIILDESLKAMTKEYWRPYPEHVIAGAYEIARKRWHFTIQH